MMFYLFMIILFFNVFSTVSFFANELVILSVDLDKINLDGDNSFYRDDPETIIHVRFFARYNKFEKLNTYKTLS